MDINSSLTSEEISVIRNAPSLFADYLTDFVRENASNADAFEEEKNLIIETLKTWWIKRSWEWFFDLMQIETDFLERDANLNSYLIDLLDAQGKSSSISHIYFELAKDQYYDGKDSFYAQLGFERSEEVWKLFRESLAIEPDNVEIRYHLINLMFQSNESTRSELFQEIRNLLLIDRQRARSFSVDVKECYDSAVLVAMKLEPKEKSSIKSLDKEIIQALMNSLEELPHKMRKELSQAHMNPNVLEAEEYVYRELPKWINSRVLNMYKNLEM